MLTYPGVASSVDWYLECLKQISARKEGTGNHSAITVYHFSLLNEVRFQRHLFRSFLLVVTLPPCLGQLHQITCSVVFKRFKFSEKNLYIHIYTHMWMWDHVQWVLFCSDYIVAATGKSGEISGAPSALRVSDNQFHMCNAGDRLI